MTRPAAPTHMDWEEARRRLQAIRAGLGDPLGDDPVRAQRVLQERARLLARVPVQAEAAAAVLQAVVFRLAGEPYGLSTHHVLEVLRLTKLTALPGAPPHAVGVVNRRGEILPVFDLRRLFEPPCADCPEATRLLVLGEERAELGILAEAADEVVALGAADVRQPQTAGRIPRSWIHGVGPNLLLILDGQELLRDPRLFLDSGKVAPEATLGGRGA